MTDINVTVTQATNINATVSTAARNINVTLQRKVSEWGTITGTLSDQTDLQAELDLKELLSNKSTTITLGTSDTLYPSQNAVKTYVDTQLTAEDLDIAGDTGTGAIDLDSQSLTIAGTTNEITTVASNQTLTISLPASVTLGTALTVTNGGVLGVDGMDLVTGNDYQINNASVLNATTLGGAIVNSSLTSLGTITSLVATTADINAGTVDAITSLTVANNVDIGNYTLTANGITVDGTITDGTASLTGGSLTSVKLGSVTGNGFVVTSGSDGTLGTDTSTYFNLDNNLVVVVHADGTTTQYAQDTDTDVGRGTILRSAVTARASGDVIYLAPATFDIEVHNIECVAGAGSISIVGSGKYSTIIKGQPALIANGPIILPASNSLVADLSIINDYNADNTTYTACWGRVSYGHGIENSVVRNVYMNGGTDTVYWLQDLNSGTTSVSMYDVSLNSEWDNVIWYSNLGTIHIYDSEITSNGNFALGECTSANGVSPSYGTVYLHNTLVSASGHDTNNYGVYVTNGDIIISGGEITTSGTGPIDLVKSGIGAGTITVSNDVKFTTSSGTITEINPFGYAKLTDTAQDITANSFITDGGASTDFVKGDGTLDGTTYLDTTTAGTTYVPYTGANANVDIGAFDIAATDGDFSGVLTVDTNTLVVNASGYEDNVGIGTATPTTVFSKTLQVYDTSFPSLSVKNSSKQWDIAAHGTGLRFYDGTGYRVTFDNTGKVGIGNTDPQYKLDVTGDVGITGQLNMLGTASNILLGDNYLSGDGSDEGIFVTSTGNIGIGIGNNTPTSSSSAFVHVKGSSAGISLQATAGATGHYSVFTSGANFGFYDENNGAYRMYILANGNVGIGTDSPAYPLDVNGTAHIGTGSGVTATGTLYLGEGNIEKASGSGFIFSSGITANGNILGTRFGFSSAPFSRFTNPTSNNIGIEISGKGEVVTINDNGNVGIGTTTPSEKLEVNGNLFLNGDNDKILLGTGKDASITYDGTNLIINPQEVGNGLVYIDGNIILTSPDSTEWNCGVSNSGVFSCS